MAWHSGIRPGDLPYLHRERFVGLGGELLDGAHLLLAWLQLALALAVQLLAHLLAVEAVLPREDVVEAHSVDHYLRHLHVLARCLLGAKRPLRLLLPLPPPSLAKLVGFGVVPLLPELAVALQQVRAGAALSAASLLPEPAGQQLLLLLLKRRDPVGVGLGGAAVVLGPAEGLGVGG